MKAQVSPRHYHHEYDFLEILGGKSIARILMNRALSKHCFLRGLVVDLGGGKGASYMRALADQLVNCRYLRTDVSKKTQPDRIVDLNKRFPFKNNTVDTLMMINVLYILDNPSFTLQECRRVLKRKGRIYVVTPFVFPYTPEPKDLWRWTEEGLELMFKKAGFNVRIVPIGGRFSAIAYVLCEGLLAPLRIVLYPLSVMLDAMFPKRAANLPILYLAAGEK